MDLGSGYTNFVGGVQGRINGGTVALKDMTYGVSASGANTYIDGVNTIAINGAISALQTGSIKVKTALEKGWQGASLIAYEKKLDDAVDLVAKTLNLIKDNIESCVTDLVQTMAEQDAHMLDSLDEFTITKPE